MPGKRPQLLPLLACCVLLTACHDSPPAAPSCASTVSSQTTTFTATGGSGAVTITTGASCVWTASADSAWVSFTGATSGTGPATVPFTVASNGETTTRRATLTVGGQPLTLSQEGRAPCQFAATPSSFDLAAAGGSGTVRVTTTAGCAWTATSSDAWVTIGSGTAGTGSGTVMFSAAAQTAQASRQATLTVAGQSIVVRQAGAAPTPPPPACEYSVSPVEVTEHWHATGFLLTIATGSGCSWTASPAEPWIDLGRSSGEGAATIQVSFLPFTDDATRRAAIQVRWPTPTAGQNVWVTQEGCRYGFDTTPVSVPAGGGAYRVNVVTQAISSSCSIGCPWTAQSNASWIRVTSSMPRAGDDAFSFEVESNAGGVRSGLIAVAGRTLAVQQAAR